MTDLDLLSIARRWVALDAGAWNGERYAQERAELLDDTREAIAKVEAAEKNADSLARMVATLGPGGLT